MNILLAFLGKRGGGGRYTLELARALATQPNVDLYLIVARESELCAEFTRLGLPQLPLHTYSNAVDFLIGTITRVGRMCRRVREYIRRERIDILIMGMIHPWSPWVIRAARRAGARVITVGHEPGPHPGDQLVLGRIMNACIADCFSYSDAVVALTQSTARAIQTAHPSCRPHVIPHGAFVYHVQRQPRSLPEDRPIRLLFFGRIVPYKGLGLLLDAAHMLQAKDRNFEIEIWGQGDLSSVAGKLRQTVNVRVENRWVDEPEIPEIFRRCDICVLPYLQASQSGIVGIAQAAGMPIVAFPEAGLVEQLATGGGVLTQASTAVALADALESILTDPSRYSAISGDAIVGARANSWPAIAAQFNDLAASVLHNA